MTSGYPSGMREKRVFTNVSLCEMDNIASWLADLLEFGQVIYLTGGLGAGKTTLVSAINRQLHGQIAASSPTFSLVHEYPLKDERSIIHLDLYRIEQADELEFIGIREYTGDQYLVFIEWWQNGSGYIPAADVVVNIENSRKNDELRTVTISCEN